MKPILLDIDGVLNPKVQRGNGGDRPELSLSNGKAALVRRLATPGRIDWVLDVAGCMVAGLEAQLQLDLEPLRVTLALPGSDDRQQNPKLRSVARWLARMDVAGESDWDSVVWIDDMLGTHRRGSVRGHPARGRYRLPSRPAGCRRPEELLRAWPEDRRFPREDRRAMI